MTSAAQVLILGVDIPCALAGAVGARAVRGRWEDLEDESQAWDAVLVSNLTAENASRYHRYVAADPAVPAVFVDLPQTASLAAMTYGEARFRYAGARLAEVLGESLDESVLAKALALEWSAALTAADHNRAGDIFVAFSPVPDWSARWGADAAGIAGVEPEQGYRDHFEVPVEIAANPWHAMAAVHVQRVSSVTRASMTTRAATLVAMASRAGASAILLDGADQSEAGIWFRSALRRALPADMDVLELGSPTDISDTNGGTGAIAPHPRPRVEKVLSVAEGFSEYQKAWFAETSARARAGQPFAVVNADAPQEILRALDVPFVVSQWWAAIAAAKGGTPRARRALEAAGFPADTSAYLSQGLASNLDREPGAPWGGLPNPDFLSFAYSDDVVAGIFEMWAEETGADLIAYDRTVECRPEYPVEWWERMPRRWRETTESERIDIMTEQLRDAISLLEDRLGRVLDRERLTYVLDLVNEQEDWFRRARDLIAQTRPAPVSIVDSIPATMIPQWHRGTEWGRDAAKAFHDAVLERVSVGEAVCPQERIRLMWAGVGLWQHMWLYQAFEKSHGAVFVWSLYLGLAADGYLRYSEPDEDPLRAMASRYVTMGDELRMPSWAGQWYVAEARRNGIDAVIALSGVEPAVVAALRADGFDVLVLEIDNLAENVDFIHDQIATFLDTLSAHTKQAE